MGCNVQGDRRCGGNGRLRCYPQALPGQIQVAFSQRGQSGKAFGLLVWIGGHIQPRRIVDQTAERGVDEGPPALVAQHLDRPATIFGQAERGTREFRETVAPQGGDKSVALRRGPAWQAMQGEPDPEALAIDGDGELGQTQIAAQGVDHGAGQGPGVTAADAQAERLVRADGLAAAGLWTKQAVELSVEGFHAALLDSTAGCERADEAYAIDVGLMVGRLDVLDVGAFFAVGSFAEGGGVAEAQEEGAGFGFFDADGETAAGVLFVGQDVETDPFIVDHRDTILDDGCAEIEFPQQVVGMPGDDGAAFETRQERGGIFNAVQQPLPDLRPLHGFDERILQVVDLDKVFEFHGPMLAFSPCNSNESCNNTALVRARAAAR